MRRLPDRLFHTVDDACREHHVDRDAFLKALRDVVDCREDGCCLTQAG